MLAKAWDAFVAEWGATMLVPNTRAQVPFQIAHVEPHDRRRIDCAHAALVNSKKLLQQPPPNLFPGEQHHDLVPPLDDLYGAVIDDGANVRSMATDTLRYHRLAAESR
jgi:hypothetical protein